MESAYEPHFFRVPLPNDLEDERDTTALERAKTLIATAEDLVRRMRQSDQNPPDYTDQDRAVAEDVFTNPSDIDAVSNNAQAMVLAGLIAQYDLKVVESADQIRTICMNVLVEKALAAKTDQAQLKAVELLGKVKDVALFDERSTVVVENMDNSALAKAIKEKIGKIKFLLNEQGVTDVEARPAQPQQIDPPGDK